MKKAKVTVKVGKKTKIKATIKMMKKGKKALPKKLCPKVCYKSADTNIAKVSKNGVVKGLKKGKCIIYVYTANGITKNVTVKVK